MGNVLSSNITVEEINKLSIRIDKNSGIINGLVDNLVKDYCKQLDDYMQYIKGILDDVDCPPTDIELDDFTLNLPVLLYFTGEAQESLGIKEDVAKAVKQEIYNAIFDNASGTIADKTARAELETQTEYLSHVIYQRAYKKVKLRMEAAYETLQSVKKVMSRRMMEYELSNIDKGRIKAQ